MIKVEGLTKCFSNVKAVDGVSFSIEKGEFYGLLGPNGAGKTTTLNILSAAMLPDSGDVMINGFDLSSDPGNCKKSVGVIPQEIALYEDLSAYENLLFWGSLYRIPKHDLRKKANEILDLMGLQDRKNDRISKYSGGMKRRINIASALLHDPQILFMDEPTVGIDPQSRNMIYDILVKLHQQGKTIIYTTHYMEEVEKLCNRVGIIDNGKIIAEGTLEELKNRFPTPETIHIRYEKTDLNKQAQLQEYFSNDAKISEEELVYSTGNASQKLDQIIRNINQLQIQINHIELQKTNLETIFLNLTGRQLRD